MGLIDLIKAFINKNPQSVAIIILIVSLALLLTIAKILDEKDRN